ncbi:hypothetical protein [Marinobacterium sp. BA1]|uniref:hypothetical protein n=1 Tax=Marinobacterium sp. BA1 TaxID=3138931 RepID=UPI0032E609BF
MITNPIIRRSTRLLAAVHELHKQGYQDLAVHTAMAPSGAYWRCRLTVFDYLQWDGEAWVDIPGADIESIEHSSGPEGYDYFGWHDARQDTARELAAKIKTRFPRLMARAHRQNYEYAGWFTYMLGIAEQGHLPVMTADHETVHGKDITTTSPDISIKRPPHRTVWQTGDHWFFFTSPPHLKPDDDWHNAYITLLAGNRNSGPYYPAPYYPIATGDIFEIGAYWEGALYYIQAVLGFTRIDEFLTALRMPPRDSERWQIFLHIWNSDGQLDTLVAFLVRVMLRDSDKYSLKMPDKLYWTRWIKAFENTNKDQWVAQNKPPHPFFSGKGNPLHLGIILSCIESGDHLC